ncbi:hypothetical protein PLANPX_2422 [Lacipirellula parvula]|uniref:PEP-CTERM protein-sorting domain-containing protein n=1 Tax=Lacipirellula parvula TaxID=2650471 RepID=A0A5K7X863_9BACT|nr:hypothetical protein PLANPX_2422 [Lacipirellula parvula]
MRASAVCVSELIDAGRVFSHVVTCCFAQSWLFGGDHLKSALTARNFPAHALLLILFAASVYVIDAEEAAASQIKFGVVAITGQAAPGAGTGVTYLYLDAPVINDAGQVGYPAYLTGVDVARANDRAIYAGPFAAPQLVSRAGDVAPGMSEGEIVLGYFSGPILNDAGQVAYHALLEGRRSAAIFAGPLTGPQLMSREGDAAPGTPAGVKYSSFFASSFNTDPPVVNDSGQAAYCAKLIGSGLTSANDTAIYAGLLGSPQLVARTGDAAPGTPAGVKYSSVGTPALNDAGWVAHVAGLTGSGVTSANDEALFAGPGGALQLVARKGDNAPGVPASVKYEALSPPALNDAGQVAYHAVLTGSGVTVANDRAIYAGSRTAPQLVARTGDAAPGMPAGVTYASLSLSLLPVLNDAGQVAYTARLKGSGVTASNDAAVYAGLPGAPHLIAREGEPAPGTPAGITYASFLTPALNDAGQTAFLARLGGDDLTEANSDGLFVSDPVLGGLLIVREGDLFDVGGGDLRTIANNGIGFLAGRSDDMSTGLSNDGTLAFRLIFTDGTNGIFTATIVPEPTAMALLVVAGLTVVCCRSLRRCS